MSVFRFNKSPDEQVQDREMREKLNAHSATPPSYIWDNIEENLPKERKRHYFIFWLMPLAACLVSLAAFLYTVMPENDSNIVVQSEINKQALKEINPENSSINIVDGNTLPAQGEKINTVKPEYSNLSFGKNQNFQTDNIQHKNFSKKPDRRIENNSNTITAKEKSSNLQEKKNFESIINEDNIDAKKEFVEEDKLTKNFEAAISDSGNKNIVIKDKLPEKKDAKPKMPEINGKKSRWAIGLESGIGYAYRFVSETSYGQKNRDLWNTNSQGGSSGEGNSNYNEIESAGLSVKSDLRIQYILNKKWRLSSGLGYSQANIRSRLNAEIQVQNNPPITSGTTDFDTIYVQKNSTGEFSYGEITAVNENIMDKSQPTQQNGVKYTFSFLDIPLQIQYRHAATKISWFVQGGPGAHFLLNKKATYTLNHQNTSKPLAKDYNSFAISADISAGIAIPLKHFDLQFGPAFSYWLTPLLPGAPKTHLYTSQIHGAIYYAF